MSICAQKGRDGMETKRIFRAQNELFAMAFLAIPFLESGWLALRTSVSEGMIQTQLVRSMSQRSITSDTLVLSASHPDSRKQHSITSSIQFR